jgi:hypothetical protein
MKQKYLSHLAVVTVIPMSSLCEAGNVDQSPLRPACKRGRNHHPRLVVPAQNQHCGRLRFLPHLPGTVDAIKQFLDGEVISIGDVTIRARIE